MRRPAAMMGPLKRFIYPRVLAQRQTQLIMQDIKTYERDVLANIVCCLCLGNEPQVVAVQSPIRWWRSGWKRERHGQKTCCAVAGPNIIFFLLPRRFLIEERDDSIWFAPIWRRSWTRLIHRKTDGPPSRLAFQSDPGPFLQQCNFSRGRQNSMEGLYVRFLPGLLYFLHNVEQ